MNFTKEEVGRMFFETAVEVGGAATRINPQAPGAYNDAYLMGFHTGMTCFGSAAKNIPPSIVKDGVAVTAELLGMQNMSPMPPPPITIKLDEEKMAILIYTAAQFAMGPMIAEAKKCSKDTGCEHAGCVLAALIGFIGGLTLFGAFLHFGPPDLITQAAAKAAKQRNLVPLQEITMSIRADPSKN